MASLASTAGSPLILICGAGADECDHDGQKTAVAATRPREYEQVLYFTSGKPTSARTALSGGYGLIVTEHFILAAGDPAGFAAQVG